MIKVCGFAAMVCVLCFFSGSLAKPAPTFALPTIQDTVSLDSLRGRVVYLDFWASWCGPCRKSFPWMDKLRETFGDRGLTIIAVNLDPKRKSADDFLAKHPIGFTVAFDSTGTVAQLYDIKGMPTSFLIDRDGNIVDSHIGFQTKDAEILETKITELLTR